MLLSVHPPIHLSPSGNLTLRCGTSSGEGGSGSPGPHMVPGGGAALPLPPAHRAWLGLGGGEGLMSECHPVVLMGQAGCSLSS